MAEAEVYSWITQIYDVITRFFLSLSIDRPGEKSLYKA